MNTLQDTSVSLVEHLARVADSAEVTDVEGRSVRPQVAALASAGCADIGAPRNHDGRLGEMVKLLADVAGRCLSTGFSMWAHRMTVEYLLAAGTPWAVAAAEELRSGRRLGVTGMASAFKEASGCGSLDLTAIGVPGGHRVSGRLRWASNVHDDSILVTSARTDSGERIVLGLRLDDDGVAPGVPFALLALNGTSSSAIDLADVFVPEEQVLTRDFEPFLASARPTFLVLQSALCLGLARACLEGTGPQLTGVNDVHRPSWTALTDRLDVAARDLDSLASRVGGATPPTKSDLLTLRLEAAELASAGAALEVRTAGGAGYARHTPTSRRFREAAFLPVQSPSESQLRWELARS